MREPGRGPSSPADPGALLLSGRRRPGTLAVALGVAVVLPLSAQTNPNPLTLSEALLLSARNNERVEIANARVDRARGIRRAAYSSLLPSLTATGTYTRRSGEVTREIDGDEVIVQARDALLGTGNLDLTLFNARAYPVAKSTDRALQAQENESEELKRSLAFEVAENFFAVLSAESLRGAALRRIELAQAVVDDSRIRLEEGLASQNELTRSELELATARLSRTQAEDLVRTTRLLLGFLIGAEAERPLTEPPPSSPEPAILALSAEPASFRADVRAAELRAESAAFLAREPWMRLFPSLGVRASYRGTNEPGLNANETDWNVAATLTWVLFDGGVRYADAAARRAEFLEAQSAASALKRETLLQIRTARANLETAQAALAEAEVRARVALQNADEVRVRLREGLATALEQADASVSAFEAEAGLAQQRFALRVAQLSLVRALGRWPADTATERPGSPAAPSEGGR